MINDSKPILLEIEFEFEEVNNKLMQVKLYYNNNSIDVTPSQNRAKVSIYVDLPTEVKLEFYGKDEQKDTIIDQHGNIIKNLHVKVSKIGLDNFYMPIGYLETSMTLVDSQQRHHQTNFVGFNGVMAVPLDQPTVFRQVAVWNTV